MKKLFAIFDSDIIWFMPKKVDGIRQLILIDEI